MSNSYADFMVAHGYDRAELEADMQAGAEEILALLAVIETTAKDLGKCVGVEFVKTQDQLDLEEFMALGSPPLDRSTPKWTYYDVASLEAHQPVAKLPAQSERLMRAFLANNDCASPCLLTGDTHIARWKLTAK